MTEYRKLSNEEERISISQLKKHKKNLISLKENQDYNEALLNKQKYLREFDDKWRQYLRNQKDEQDILIFQQMKDELENIKSHISQLDKQLKKGVKQYTSNLTN